MTLTLSPPIRVFALVGIIAATALGAFFFLVARPGVSEGSGSPAASTTSTVGPGATKPATPTRGTETPTPQRRPRSAPLQTKSGFPLKIDRALRKGRPVIVVVYMPGSSVDRIVLGEALRASRRSRASYVPVSALNERVARQLVAKTGVLPQPAVLVLKNPGIVVATLSVTDSETIAQAVALARR